MVAAVRRSLGGVKTGHAGTLDPFATGLLVVLLGRATKSQAAFMGLPKRYETVAQLGALSSTGDPEGEITLTGRVPPDPRRCSPSARSASVPPRHSAVKVGGERAYRRARRGEDFETARADRDGVRLPRAVAPRDALPGSRRGRRTRSSARRAPTCAR